MESIVKFDTDTTIRWASVPFSSHSYGHWISRELLSKMKIFRTVQKYYAIVGIRSTDKSTESNSIFNKRVAFGSLVSGYNIVSQFLYIIYVADDFLEYIECVCATFASIIIFVNFAAIALRKNTLFEIIDKVESLIDTSRIFNTPFSIFFVFKLICFQTQLS